MKKHIALALLISGSLGCCPKITCLPRFNYDLPVKDLEMENAALKAIIEHEARVIAEKEACVFPNAFEHPGAEQKDCEGNCGK